MTSPDQHSTAFAQAAEDYCAWAELPPHVNGAEDARTVFGLVCNLLRLALVLPDVFSEVDPQPIEESEHRQIYERCGSLPFKYYSECFNPLNLEAEAPVVADLADDLADIWRDVNLACGSGTKDLRMPHYGNGVFIFTFTGAITRQAQSTPYKAGSRKISTIPSSN
jgi:hypothetical protein